MQFALIRLPICASCKRKFVVCPFVDEKTICKRTKGTYRTKRTCPPWWYLNIDVAHDGEMFMFKRDEENMIWRPTYTSYVEPAVLYSNQSCPRSFGTYIQTRDEVFWDQQRDVVIVFWSCWILVIYLNPRILHATPAPQQLWTVQCTLYTEHCIKFWDPSFEWAEDIKPKISTSTASLCWSKNTSSLVQTVELLLWQSELSLWAVVQRTAGTKSWAGLCCSQSYPCGLWYSVQQVQKSELASVCSQSYPPVVAVCSNVDSPQQSRRRYNVIYQSGAPRWHAVTCTLLPIPVRSSTNLSCPADDCWQPLCGPTSKINNPDCGMHSYLPLIYFVRANLRLEHFSSCSQLQKNVVAYSEPIG
jgi:hypothetical protein